MKRCGGLSNGYKYDMLVHLLGYQAQRCILQPAWSHTESPGSEQSVMVNLSATHIVLQPQALPMLGISGCHALEHVEHLANDGLVHL
jgi:hypothetical protein